MENKETNKNSAAEGAKKHKTHFIASMAILATALVAAIIIAVVAIVSGLGGKVTSGPKEINGNSATELYSQIVASVESEKNYALNITKHGTASLTVAPIASEVLVTAVLYVDGDNFYYKSTTNTTNTQLSNQSAVKIEEELTLIDGMLYFTTKRNGTLTKREKYEADPEAIRESLASIESFIWSSDKLFANAGFEKTGSGYTVKTSADDADLQAAVALDIVNVFSTNSGWILNKDMPIFRDVNYSVNYDNNLKPTKIDYNYDISGSVAGESTSSVQISYGSAKVTLPSNVADYDKPPLDLPIQ